MSPSRSTPAELDLRVRALLGGTDPQGHPLIELSGEVGEILSAAVAELGEELAPPLTGVGLVIGAGVLDRLRVEAEPSSAPATSSRLDKRC
jgi:hypothetical protein